MCEKEDEKKQQLEGQQTNKIILSQNSMTAKKKQGKIRKKEKCVKRLNKQQLGGQETNKITLSPLA